MKSERMWHMITAYKFMNDHLEYADMFSVLTIGALIYKYPNRYQDILNKVNWVNEIVKDAKLDVRNLIRRYVEVADLELMPKPPPTIMGKADIQENDNTSSGTRLKKRDAKHELKNRDESKINNRLDLTSSESNDSISNNSDIEYQRSEIKSSWTDPKKQNDQSENSEYTKIKINLDKKEKTGKHKRPLTRSQNTSHTLLWNHLPEAINDAKSNSWYIWHKSMAVGSFNATDANKMTEISKMSDTKKYGSNICGRKE